MPSTLRITGLATGLDVDNMVKQLMQAEKTKVDKVKQQRQLIQWRQDLYREIIGDLNTFKSTFFDVLNKDKYILSANSLAPYSVSIDSNAPIKVTATADAQSGQYEVAVSQLAKGATVVGELNAENLNLDTKLSSLGLSGITKIDLTYNGTGTSIEVNGDMSIRDLINEVNSETNGAVKVRFSELTKNITFETSKTGESASLKITGASFLNINDMTDAVTGQNAKFKIKTPNNSSFVEVQRETNTFTIDGITYTLNGLASEENPVKFTVNVDSKPVIDKIKEFVNKYNEIIDKINKKLSEKRAYSYQPLTDDQKKEMKEDEIKMWEEKAKEGLLKGDSILQNMIFNLRQAFFQSVKDVGISLQEVGLSTSSDYTQKGKIIIDEAKLKTALETRGQDVINLFVKTSTIAYDPNKTYSGREDRNAEIGIFQRIKDILEDNIRTTRNSSGKKGLLLEKAGIKGDFTEFNNLLSKELQEKDRLIDELNKKLAEKEDKYYRDFAKLEAAMQKFNDQANWLYSQLGAMNK
ncbi:flagellar filament capping protein FliD [Caloramator sp. CAR-1]|uniref:flagellar filament capping protein FliD n=1 Tax=Caloramator sp. CAR-1 TaxID=3062777 RepID=UPI0026E24ACA|nr:flagellar filament capping protein FliD [Caloramator sp. CAR-1]MDO6355383.1 flagellar filament capping protein FliD [Caloramator sp. CAR-1]